MQKLKSYLKYTSAAGAFFLTGCFMLPDAEARHHHHHHHHGHHPENVAIVLPLSGSQSTVANQLKNAALLGLNDPHARHTAIIDINTVKTVADIQTELDKAEANIIIGPLLAEESEELAPLVKEDNYIFSLTSDERAAQHHEWVMGITPLQQIKPLINLAVERNHKNFAAFLPDNNYGHAMGDAFEKVCEELHIQPKVIYHGFSNAALEQDFNKLITKSVSEEGNENVGFDALFLGDTGAGLKKVMRFLPQYKVDSHKVQIMGPSSWQLFDGTLGALADAWYAAPAEMRQSYKNLYRQEFGQTPLPISVIAYDVGLLANNIHKDPNIVSSDQGFTGLNGWFKLQDDGHVERSLSIYKILAGGGAGRIFQAPEMAAEENPTQAEQSEEKASIDTNSQPKSIDSKSVKSEGENTAPISAEKPPVKGFFAKLGFGSKSEK